MPRPPGYERQQVLSKATEVFWQRGYRATSVSHLVAATGLRPGSLYAAFGSKKGLFLEVLDRYHEEFMRDVEQCLARADTHRGAVHALFEHMAETTLGQAGERGCLAVNTLLEMAQHDAEIAANLRAQNERLRLRLQDLLDHAQQSGELAAGQDTDNLSVFLLNNLWGMRVMCKSVPTRTALDSIIGGVMGALAGPPAQR